MGGQQFGRHGPLQAYFLSLIPSGLTPEEKRRAFRNRGTEASRSSREDPFPRFQNDGSCTKKAPDVGSFFVCRFPGNGTIFRNTVPGEPGRPDERRTCSPLSERSSPARKRTARPFPWLSDRDAGSVDIPSAVPRLRAAPAEAGRLMKNSAVPRPDGKNPKSADRVPLPPVF